MRYFLLFWTATFPAPEHNTTGFAKTQTAYMSETFLSKEQIVADIQREHPNFEQISITNLIELSKDDYEIWISKDRKYLEPRYEADILISYD